MARRKTLNRKLNKTRKAYRKTKYRLAKALAQIEAIKNLPKGDELPTGGAVNRRQQAREGLNGT